jgi:thiol-disulfide isomerase/thioredoxin
MFKDLVPRTTNRTTNRATKRACSIALTCAAIVAVAFSTNVVANKTIPGKVPVGDTPPAALGIDSAGNAISTKDYEGKVLVVTFWASWCGPCRKEMPILENVQTAGKGNIQVVAVNIEDRDQFRKISRVLAPFKIKISHDYNKGAGDAYGVKGIPHMVIIGKDGKVRNVHTGYSEEMIDGLVDEINAALLDKPNATSENKTAKTDY